MVVSKTIIQYAFLFELINGKSHIVEIDAQNFAAHSVAIETIPLLLSIDRVPPWNVGGTTFLLS
jgi:hypothetical protein